MIKNLKSEWNSLHFNLVLIIWKSRWLFHTWTSRHKIHSDWCNIAANDESRLMGVKKKGIREKFARRAGTFRAGPAVFPLRKFHTEQMFVLLRTKRMQLRNHACTQTVKRSQRWKDYAIYIYRIKFRMSEVRENEMALRKLSGGTARLPSCAP